MWIWCWLSCWWWNYMVKCVYMYTLCYHSKLMKYNVVVDELLMNSWLVVVVIIMRCCCWWLMQWVIIIIELEVDLCCSWRFLWKMGQMVNCVKMMFWFQVLYSFEYLLCTYTYKQPLGTNLDVAGSNFGFLGEKWCKNRNNRRKLARNSLLAKSVWNIFAISEIA